MPSEAVGAVIGRHRLGGAGPHIGAALLLRHRHARSDAGLAGGDRQLGVVDTAGEQRLVDPGQFGVVAQRRDDGIGHRDRADVSGLRGPHAHLRRAHDMGARPVIDPRCRVQAVCDRHPHQLVVGRVVLDLVDPVSVAVVGVQHRTVTVGQFTPALRRGATRDRTQFGDLVDAPLTALTNEGLHQSRRGGGVVIDERRDLIGDDVGIRHDHDVTFF